MPIDENTVPPDEAPEPSIDPLGIIGWVIGGKYKIRAHIGGGGFGEVYEGFNVNLTEQRVVVKFFKRVQARDKFDKEAKILCQLDHPNINRVIDYLPDEGAVVVAFIDGKDANVRLKDSGAFGEALFLKVAKGIASAITYAHSKKIAHRDMKPANIIIDKNDNVYLIDFGIAKEIGGDATKTAYQALTPMIAAPERQQGDKDYNPFLSDIYETGITLYNLATNSLPYRNPINPDINEWGGPAAKKLSPELRRILVKATHPDPKARYNSASDFCNDLNALERAFGSTKKMPTGLIITATIVVILGVIGWEFGGGLWSRIETALLSDPPAQSEPTIPATSEGIDENLSGEAGETTSSENTPAPPKEVDKKVSGQAEEEKKKDTDASSESGKPKTSSNQTKPPVRNLKADNGSAKLIIPKTSTADKDQINHATPPPPPPIVKSNLLINVTPDNITKMTVDGLSRQPGKRFEIDPGSHTLYISHPDYPVYRSQMRAKKGSDNWPIDLKPTRPTDTITLQLAMIPPSEDHFLELSFNGRTQKISRFPVLDLPHPAGDWDVALAIKSKISSSNGSDAVVDSCVIIPSDPAGRQVLTGSNGVMKFMADDKLRSRMLIYWSEK